MSGTGWMRGAGAGEGGSVTQGHRHFGLQGPGCSCPQVHLPALAGPLPQESQGESKQKLRRQTGAGQRQDKRGKRIRGALRFLEG